MELDRKEKFKKRRLKRTKRFLVSFVLIIAVAFSSLSVSFAHQDIDSLLTNWFNQKKGESISEINLAVNQEKEKQTKHLKRELEKQIREAERELDQLTKSEKDKRVKAVRDHANHLIKNLDVSIDNQEANRVRKELDNIMADAIQKMNNVRPNVEKSKKEDLAPVTNKAPAKENVPAEPVKQEAPEPEVTKEKAAPAEEPSVQEPQSVEEPSEEPVNPTEN